MEVLRKGEPLRHKGIRPCRLGDLDAIMEIEEASFHHPYSYSTFWSFLRHKSEGFVVAEENNGELVGYCIFSKHGSRGAIISIAVKRSQRRKGWGSSLLRYSISKLSKEVSSIELQVAVGNGGSIAFYESFGFQPVGHITGYYHDGEDALLMELDTTTISPRHF